MSDQTRFEATCLAPISVAFADDARRGEIVGYGSAFNVKLDDRNELVAPGAFVKSLQLHRSRGTTPAMLWGHDLNEPIGKWNDLIEDSYGLRASGKLTLDVARARDALALAKDGAMALSIGYLIKSSKIVRGTGEKLVTEIDLLEISLVSIPANPGAQLINVNNFDPSAIRDERTFEAFLREAGFSRSKAKAITSVGFKSASTLRDADASDSEIVKAITQATAAIGKFKV